MNRIEFRFPATKFSSYTPAETRKFDGEDCVSNFHMTLIEISSPCIIVQLFEVWTNHSDAHV